MTVKELYERLSLSFPTALSCPWDHDGLAVCPDPGKQVSRVLVTLDVTKDAVGEAIRLRADVILSHHPLLFHPLDALTPGDPAAEKALDLVKAGISCMSFHTRADAASGGVSDLLAGALSLGNVSTVGEDGILRIGCLSEATNPKRFAELLKERLGCPAVNVADAGKPIRWVAVLGGEGKDMISLAKDNGADAAVAGRFGYHAMQDGKEAGISLFEAGHYFTEAPILDRFASLVRKACDAEVTVLGLSPLTLY